MDRILTYSGLVISVGAAIVLMVFAARQLRLRHEAQRTPMKYQEWLAQYKTKKFYIVAAEVFGIILAIIGLNL